jgi:ribosomal protein L35
MPKLKTHKATKKRVKISKGKKVIVRKAGQGHFNARDKGEKTMGKRRDRELSKDVSQNFKTFIPYDL